MQNGSSGEEHMDDRKIDEIASTVDEMATTLEEMKETPHGGTSKRKLDKIQKQLEHVGDKLNDIDDKGSKR
jgi:hypothetical protein